MGCALVVQEGCLISLYAGEAEGVLTYRYEADDLPAAMRRVLTDWPEFEKRARRGAEIVRREFNLTRVASQHLRFLAYRAAKPRPKRRGFTSPAQRVYKRPMFSKGGGCPDRPR